MTVLAIFLTVMSLLLCCICVCHCCWGELKGAYDDLAAITMASAGPLMSGEHFYTTTVATTQSEEENEEFYNTQEQETSNESVVDADADADADTPTQQQQDEEANTNEQEQPQPLQEDETNDHYVLMNDSSRQNTTVDSTTTPLLHPSSRPHFHDHNIEEPATHMKALNRMCSIMYCCSVVLVVTLTATIIFFFPKPPVYNVCNDAVAWKQIMEKLALLKLDFSIEILVSVSNSNHLSVVLDEGKGSFTFEGISVGTFHIPGDNVQRMAVTDLMLIARVQPDKYQAVKMAEYYYQGKLVLKAEFEAKLRVPAFMDFTYNLDMKNLTVFVNELSDRSLCHCPSWDNNQTTTTTTPLLFF